MLFNSIYRKFLSNLLVFLMLCSVLFFHGASATQNNKAYVEPDVVSEYGIAVTKHIVREREKEEDLSSLVYSNPDGSSTCYIFDEPIKYYDNDGVIQDKSNQEQLHPLLSLTSVLSIEQFILGELEQTQHPRHGIL